MAQDFDLFLSHNSVDKSQVRQLDRLLTQQGLKPWLDERELPPGSNWMQGLDAGIHASRCAAVLLGPAGLGPWHEGEMEALLDQARRGRKRIIPVLLPGFEGELPTFLGAYSFVDLRGGLAGTEFDRLVAAVREAPFQPPAPAVEYRLEIRRDGEGHQACWIDPENKRSQNFPLTLPLEKADLDELSWYLETYLEFPGAGDEKRAQNLERQLTAWGDALFAALFPTVGGMEHPLYQSLIKRAVAGERCLLTIDSQDPEVLVRPWEMLRNRRGPLAFQGVSLRRRLGEPDRVPQPLTGSSLRVLLIVSRPSDTGFIDPRTSTRPVLDALDQLAGGVQVDFCEPPTLAELERRISAARKEQRPFHIVHFDGHGTYLPRTGVGALCFEQEDETTHLVAGQTLGDTLVRLQVPLVLLEACRGAQLSNRPVFGSVAPALLQSGVGSVLAFSHAVHVEAARILVERLYRELAGGAGIGEALQEARSALHANQRRWLTLGPAPETVELQDWIIPQLYQVGDDPVLVPGAAPLPEGGSPTREQDGLHDFPPPPRYRFQGRARELLNLERAFRKHPAVLLHAMGGMGKTALAREAAHWWRRTGRFAAALFHSFEQQAGAQRVVQRLGQVLAGEDFARLGADEQWREAVRLFHERPVLLVWDNYESVLPAFADARIPGEEAEEALPGMDAVAREELLRLYRELTEGDPWGRLLVTCRPVEAGLPGIRELGLEGLARPDALHLLRAVTELKSINLERDGYDREEVDRLLDKLEEHPLSIELVAPHLKSLTPQQILDDFADLIERFSDAEHREGRNRSLLASLEFSRRRLSPEAQRALPWLGWFEGGVYEQFFLDFAELESKAWAGIRTELEATALLRVVGEGIQVNDRPFLKLHPTLPDAARAEPLADPEAARRRFIGVYLRVMGAVDQALGGSQPAAGMALMAREEVNLRRALTLCFRLGEFQAGQGLTNTLSTYLQRAGRNRERDTLVTWVRERLPEERLDGAVCAAILDHAWSLFTQGQGQQAVEQVQELLHRLEAGELAGENLKVQLALTRHYLGRIYFSAGRSDLALAPLRQAIQGYEALGEGQHHNLAAALGDLANTYRNLGRTELALEAAERGLAIVRELGHDREIAAAHGQIAAILRGAGHLREAGERYLEALTAAKAAGDRELQGTSLQHMGGLEDDQGRPSAAAERYRQALRLFQQTGNQVGEMQTCDLLATTEGKLGHLEVAEAWYRRALELADVLGDLQQKGVVAQNLGILHQTRAEAVSDDPAERERLLHLALDSVERSLAAWTEMQNQVHAASSYYQIGILHRLLGDLDRAEENALKGLEIREPLGLPDVWKDYSNLAEIAHERQDTEAAARWQAKQEAAEAERDRRARGPETREDQPPPEQLIQLLLALAQAAHQARESNTTLDPQAAEFLAQMREADPPLDAFAAFLAAVAEGETPSPPAGLPEPMEKLAEALLEAL